MTKKVIVFISIFFFSFVGMSSVKADCADIGSKITIYNEFKEKLSTMNCAEPESDEIANSCNQLTMDKNLIVTQLMKLDEQNAICEVWQSDVEKIIDENSSSCHQIFDDDLNDFVNRVMTLFYIVGPILLIIFGTIDYSKAVVGDEKELKAANKRFIRRLIATILLFLSPVIVNIILTFNVSEYYLSGNAYACDFNYVVFHKKWNIRYVPRKSRNKKSEGSAHIGGTRVGDYIIFKQNDPQWASEKLINSSAGNPIGTHGCALTSVAMQIANSGVDTIEPVSPLTLNTHLRKYISGGGMVWGSEGISSFTNGKFALEVEDRLTGDINDKANQLSNYLSQGYYPVIQVKTHGDTSDSHYVAVFAVENGNIIIGDPANYDRMELIILNNEHQYRIANDNYSSELYLYKVIK